jgi:hypothetical protein
MEVRGEWDELGAVPVHQPLLQELLKLLHEHGGLLRVWTDRMPLRPRTSGRLTTIRRSNRPGRSSAGSSTSGRLADGDDLIDEHDAGGVLLALLDQVADAGCPDAYEHLNEIEPPIEKNGTSRPLLVPRKGRKLLRVAFLSTAAPRRGTSPT